MARDIGGKSPSQESWSHDIAFYSKSADDSSIANDLSWTVFFGMIVNRFTNAANAGGGEFQVTTGLLAKANDDHLRGVLAHEIAHDDLRHVARAQTLGIGLNIGVILLEQFIPGSSAVTPIAGTLIANSYSRSEELEADRHAVEILRRAGYSKEV